MVPGSSAKWAAKWLREILTALREIGREMIPRNFAQPSAKFSQPSAKSGREIFTKRLSMLFFEFGTASAKFPEQIFEKKFEKGAPRNRGKFGGIWWRRSLQFGGFLAEISGYY